MLHGSLTLCLLAALQTSATPPAMSTMVVGCAMHARASLPVRTFLYLRGLSILHLLLPQDHICSLLSDHSTVDFIHLSLQARKLSLQTGVLHLQALPILVVHLVFDGIVLQLFFSNVGLLSLSLCFFLPFARLVLKISVFLFESVVLLFQLRKPVLEPIDFGA
jgi:hypothetical protein